MRISNHNEETNNNNNHAMSSEASFPVSAVPTMDVLLQMYLDTLDEKEQIAYNIAKTHLGSSFSLEKSNGFVEWRKKNYIDKK